MRLASPFEEKNIKKKKKEISNKIEEKSTLV
jgi:hypothetical protein